MQCVHAIGQYHRCAVIHGIPVNGKCCSLHIYIERDASGLRSLTFQFIQIKRTDFTPCDLYFLAAAVSFICNSDRISSLRDLQLHIVCDLCKNLTSHLNKTSLKYGCIL